LKIARNLRGEVQYVLGLKEDFTVVTLAENWFEERRPIWLERLVTKYNISVTIDSKTDEE
jgi:hypothetical protein